MAIETVEKFISETAKSLRAETFVKLTLGNYKGADAHLQKILVRLVETKKGTKLFFLYRHVVRTCAMPVESCSHPALGKGCYETRC